MGKIESSEECIMKISWKVNKIKCQGCVQTIAETLLLVDGLSEVIVNPEDKTVSFQAQGQPDVDMAKRALIKAGYPPEV